MLGHTGDLAQVWGGAGAVRLRCEAALGGEWSERQGGRVDAAVIDWRWWGRGGSGVDAQAVDVVGGIHLVERGMQSRG